MVPSSETAKDITGWVPAANATVTLIDSEGVTHTVTTDEDGYYTFTDITVNANTIITATATVNGNTVVMKDVVPQAVAGIEDYDAGTMNVESTALGLIVEELTEQGLTPEDINLQEIQASDNFAEVVEQVSSVLEENGNVTTDPDVTEVVNNTAEEIINPPAPEPEPEPTPTPPTPVLVSAITVTGNNTVVNGQTLQLGITVTPDNATNKTVTWSVAPGTGAATISASGLLTATGIGTVSVKAVAQDGSLKEGTKAITVTAPVVAPTITMTDVPANVTTEAAVAEDENGLIAEFTETDRTPIAVTLTKGSADYSNVRVEVTGLDDGVQLIAQDTAGNWYNIVTAGWGPGEGFALADATTDVYLVANTAGTYTATINLVDVSDGDEVLATTTASVTAEAVPMTITADVPEFTVGVPDTFTVGTIANSDAGKMVRAHFTIPDGVTVEYQEGGTGDWLPLEDVFGPTDGFPLGDITTTFRGTFADAGSKTVTVEFRTVDGDELLGSKDITAIAAEAAPTITMTDVPANVTTEAAVAEDENGLIAEFTETDRTPIAVTLTKGSADYSNVRVEVTGLDDGVQLIAQDTAGNWYNIVKTGWGPSEGFPLADAITDVYLVANTAGTYTATINLVDLNDNNAVLATATATSVVERTIIIRWLEDAVRFYPDGSVQSSWKNALVPDSPDNYEGPVTLILTNGEYLFADINAFYSYTIPGGYEGTMAIDGTGQLSGDVTYTSGASGLPIKEHLEGEVEIITEAITGEIDDGANHFEDYDGTMVGTYTQRSYAYGTQEEVLAAYPKAVLAPEQGLDWWFTFCTEYIAHGEVSTI